MRAITGFPRIKKILRILFVYDESARLDLFSAFPGLKRFFLNRRNLSYLRTAGDLLFTIIILLGLFGPQDPTRNISLFIAWGIWWTSVVMSWFFVGKFWCGICPFPGIGTLLQRFGLTLELEPPHIIRKNLLHLSVILFGVIIWAEAVTDMKHWPLGTALLLLSILLGATFMAILFKGQAWCRYVCPLGKIIGSGATMSMLELRSDPAQCRSCTTYACKKGREELSGCPVYLGAHNVKHNLDCLLCGRCVMLCEKGNPRLRLRNPFVELVMNKGRNLTCTFIVPFLMGSQLARLLQHGPWYSHLERFLFGSSAAAFTALLLLGFAIFLIIIRLGDRCFGIVQSDPLGRFSPLVPILLPLAFTGELIDRLEYLLAEMGSAFPVFGRQFGIDLDHWSFEVPYRWISVLSFYLLCLGWLGAHHVVVLFRKGEFNEIITPATNAGLHALIAVVVACYAALLAIRV